MVGSLQVDVIICGGGLVGGVLAISLAQLGLEVAVIDRESSENLVKPELDGRTTAVSYGSQRIFAHMGVWSKVEHAAEPILNIRVFEHNSPWAVYYNHQDLGEMPMGYIVDNMTLRQGIFARARELSKYLHWIAPSQVSQAERNCEGVVVHLKDGRLLNASLLVGAEGRLSETRETAGLKMHKWSYEQVALIAHVCHELPHAGSAWEVFQSQGPLAFLPLRSCPVTGAHRSGIVWTGSEEDINRLLTLDDSTFSKELQALFPYLGTLKISGKRWSYPLYASIAPRIIDHRLVIVGDAAHTLHPVAGQGVNLGWRDAYELADAVSRAKRLGLDVGSKSILEPYQQNRRLDTASILAMSDGMVRLFSNKSSILSFLRNTGLGVVNQIPPLKRFLMRQAMGI